MMLAPIFLALGVNAIGYSVSLKQATFDKFIDDNPATLVKFFSPGCKKCFMIKAEYEVAAEELFKGEPSLRIGEVDCTEEEELCRKYSVRAYPHLTLFKYGQPFPLKVEKGSDYTDAVKEAAKPPVAVITPGNYQEFVTRAPVTVLGFFSPEHQMQAQAFHEAAKGHGVVFGSTQDQSIMARHESASPGFIVFQNVDQQKHKFAGEFTRESIQHFIDRRSIGLFGEVGPDNIQLYLKPKLPIAYVFLESKDQQAEHAYITHVAKQFYNDVIVAMVNATENPARARDLRLKDEWPCVAINQGKYNYPLEQSLPLSRERLTAFLKDFIQNKMKPTWRSEEAVEINDDDTVSVLVGTTVKQFVQDTRYDVLLNVFSSSNDLSRKLAPIWSTLADELEDVDIKMAVFNADLNDMPQNVLEIQYIPTIVLFKSQTNEKVLFLKKPSVNALKDFLREHSGLKHLVPANKTKKVKKTKKIQSAEQEEL